MRSYITFALGLTVVLFFSGCVATPTLPVTGTLTSNQTETLLSLEVAGNLALQSASPADKVVVANDLVSYGSALSSLASGAISSTTISQADALVSKNGATASQLALYQSFTALAQATWSTYYAPDANTATAAQWLKIIATAAINVGTANGGSTP